jgi:hypothetical protein
LGACGPVAPSAGSGGSTGNNSTDATSTSMPTSTTATPTSTGPSTSDPSCADGCLTSEPGGVLVTPDAGESPVPCDTYAQDCEDGQKCAPWATESGAPWQSSKCVPVTGDRLPGEPCTAEGEGVSGLDDCVKAAFCWNVDEQGHGVCVALCGGASDQPTCEQPGFECAVLGGEAIWSPCLAICQPLVQDCADDELCLPTSGIYFCVPDGSDEMGAAFDPCEVLDECDAGLLCLGPASASECDQGTTGCCQPMCSIADGGASCPGEGQSCLAFYEPQPEGFEDVGYCSLNQ